MTPQRSKMLNALIAVLAILFLWLLFRRCQPITSTAAGFSIPPSNFIGGNLVIDLPPGYVGPVNANLTMGDNSYSFDYGDMIYGGNTFDSGCPTCCNQSGRYIPSADQIARALGFNA